MIFHVQFMNVDIIFIYETLRNLADNQSFSKMNDRMSV